MGRPVIAIVGSFGYVGSFLTPAFLDALISGRVKEVRILASSKALVEGEKGVALKDVGATVVVVNFGRKETLVAALKGVDVVICAMGTGPGSVEARRLLLEAMVMTGVDVYFPSEWGTNHYDTKRMGGLDHTVFAEKKEHWMEVGLKPGLKRVRFHCGMIMESTFGTWAGLDCKKGVWRVPGNGETPIAFTAAKDIGRFAVEAALLAFSEPGKIPEALEVVGDTASLKDCATLMDAVSGKKTKLHMLSYQDALTKQTTSKDFLSIFPLLFQAGALNLKRGEANGNAILNPNEEIWQLVKLADFARQTGGIP
jgi:hypothetical protein